MNADIEVMTTAWHVISAFMIALGGMAVCLELAKKVGIAGPLAAGLYLWHTMLCLVYCWYVLTFGGDAIVYYRVATTGDVRVEFGTSMVSAIAKVVVQVTGTSLVGTFLAFNIAGAVGLIIFAASLQKAAGPRVTQLRPLILLIVFLPSASFWTSSIGKDSLAFLAVCLVLWASIDDKKRTRHLVIGVLIMLLVRPHIAGLMACMIVMASFGTPSRNLLERVGHLLFLGLFTTQGLPRLLEYVGLVGVGSLGEVGDFIDQRQQYNLNGGAAIDIASMPLPLQLLSYLFRPHPLEAWSIFALVASFEGLFLGVVVLLGVHAYLLGQRSKNSGGNRLFLWLYVVSGTFILATTSANLGISLRQKWMIMPVLIFLMISAVGQQPSGPAASVRGDRRTRPQGASPPPPVVNQYLRGAHRLNPRLHRQVNRRRPLSPTAPAAYVRSPRS